MNSFDTKIVHKFLPSVIVTAYLSQIRYQNSCFYQTSLKIPKFFETIFLYQFETTYQTFDSCTKFFFIPNNYNTRRSSLDTCGGKQILNATKTQQKSTLAASLCHFTQKWRSASVEPFQLFSNWVSNAWHEKNLSCDCTVSPALNVPAMRWMKWHTIRKAKIRSSIGKRRASNQMHKSTVKSNRKRAKPKSKVTERWKTPFRKRVS